MERRPVEALIKASISCGVGMDLRPAASAAFRMVSISCGVGILPPAAATAAWTLASISARVGTVRSAEARAAVPSKSIRKPTPEAFMVPWLVLRLVLACPEACPVVWRGLLCRLLY